MAVICLHLVLYYLVTRVNSLRPDSTFRDPSAPLDGLIPMVGWTWLFYWAAYPYLTLGAGLVVGRLREEDFRRALAAFVAITLIGAVVQLAVPVRAPWPQHPHAMQEAMHGSAWTRPYACLPSMHVAYAVLTASLGVATARRRPVRLLHGLLAAAIAISTLTLKEHYVADAATGALLGVAAGTWWRTKRRPGTGRPAPRSHELTTP